MRLTFAGSATAWQTASVPSEEPGPPPLAISTDTLTHLLLALRVYAPDFFNEESLGKVAPTPELREKVNLQEFLGKYHPREWAWERASKWISDIRKAHPNAKVGTVGFCWGAPTTLKAADKNTPKEQSADALAFAHGSLVQVTDFDNVSKPGLYITPEHDAIFTEEIRLGGIEKTKQLAKENGVYSRWSYYPLVSHGFAVRGDEGDAYQSRAMRDAVEELVIHFKHSLE